MDRDSYFDRYALDYDDSCRRVPVRWFKPEELATVESWLPSNKNLRCLDLGSGVGAYTKLLLEFGFSNTYAIDKSQPMLDKVPLPIARKHCADAEVGFTYGEFDLIVCAGLLEFADEPEKVLENIKAALRSNGEVLLLSCHPSILSTVYKMFHQLRGQKVKSFDRDSLRRIVESKNLELVSFQRVTSISFLCRLKHA